tara:strand:+ start:350 stop:523 length:174 start_codon:yes stop_codon:yes gene_type:complete
MEKMEKKRTQGIKEKLRKLVYSITSSWLEFFKHLKTLGIFRAPMKMEILLSEILIVE